MNWKNKKKISIQASVVLILLLSVGVSAVHPAAISTATEVLTVESMFHFGDVPYITVTVTPPSLMFGQRMLAGQPYATVQLPDEGVTTVIGEAQLPTISRFLEIPQGAVPTLVVESVSWETVSLASLNLPSSVIPVQPSLIKIEGATVPFSKDDTFYARDMSLPSSIATVNTLGELRSRQIGFLQVSPVQYNPVSGVLRVMTQCVLRIDLPGSDLVKTAEKIDRYTTTSFEQLFETSFMNYGDLQGTSQMGPKQEGYLIIVDDDFVDAITPLADWKDSKGFDVTVTKTSEISGGPTKENIKNYFVDAYNTWPVPPTYILLVGDVAQIPSWTGSDTGTCTDLYYVTIDQGNYFADIIISRFSAATAQQVTTMVEKTLYYEEGNFENDSWVKKAAFIASSDMGGMAEDTHNFVIDSYLTPNNYTCDKIWESQGGSTADITNALNDGRSLCIYSGHGYSGGWATGPYDQSDVENLQNQGMYPFVCSHACSTNPFSQSECFGETWLRVENKGGIAFWGASASTYWDEDDILEKRMFKAWWEDNLETIGGMTNMGLYYLYQEYGGGGMTQYYFEAYNVLGDSSVKIWRGQSNVNTPPAIPDTPVGPATGEIGIEYTFTTRTTDAQNNDVFYIVAWGDTVSDWLGPYASGATVELTHTWAFVGDYSISVKAKDSQGLESYWSDSSSISIVAVPRIEIGNITASFGSVSVQIKNVGAGDATDVDWSISLDGKLVFLGKETTGTFTKIVPGFGPRAKTGFVFGFGRVDILVTVGDLEKTVTATLLGPFFLKVGE
ncbi:MAG TPA: C25 family cysteine peptidase [Candidatus Thermoplasmatota archaeon]|nr:C25 family cysteine peptidase [Candidatus Thermoplasmatota archaeon]